MAAERRNLSLSPIGAQTLDLLCELEGGVSQSAEVERSLETRLHLLDVLLRWPREERGRLARLCVLPEGVPAPKGAEVFRLYVPLLMEKESLL